MKDNLGLMLIIFGGSILYWFIFMFLLEYNIFSLLILFFIATIIVFWGLRPNGESKKWDKFKKKIMIIFYLPVLLVSYKNFIGD
jgi:hypothetical protein